MNTDDLSPVNEWNNHHAYLANPLSDNGHSAGNPTNRMTTHLPLVSRQNGQGQMQDRATRLLTERPVGPGRRIR